MDRDRLFGNIRDNSRFKESSDDKIRDTRGHESYINDRRDLNSKAYENSTGIRDKINTGRYEHRESGAHVISGADRRNSDNGKESHGNGTDDSKSHGRSSPDNTAADRTEPDATRYVDLKTIKWQLSKEDTVPIRQKDTQKDIPPTDALKEKYREYLKASSGKRKSVDRDIEVLPPPDRNKAKIKGNGKEALKKKADRGKDKFREKIKGSRKKSNLDKVRTQAVSNAVYKANEEDKNDAVQAMAAAYQLAGNTVLNPGVHSLYSGTGMAGRAAADRTAPQISEKVMGKTEDSRPGRKVHADGTVNRSREKALGKIQTVNKAQKKSSDGKYVNRTMNSGSASGISKGVLRNSAETAGRTAASIKAGQIRAAQDKKVLKDFRDTKRAEKRVIRISAGIKQHAVRFANKLKRFAARNATALISIFSFLIVIIVVSAMFSSCAMAFTTGVGSYLGGTSDAPDHDMTDTDSYFTQKEMELQEKIDNIQSEYHDYDEYVYDIADIGHEPAELMAYLSAKYGTYDLSKVKGELDELFSGLYTLTVTPRTETRTRMVRKTAEDGTEYEVSEEYEWRILTVTLIKKDLKSMLKARLSEEEKKMYEIYSDTEGAHQAFYNPFTVDWKQHVSSEFGWRIHPISGKEKFHNGIDIALPTGTEIHACSTGTVIQSYFSSSAGNYVVVQDATGYTCHYMHLSSRSVAVGDTVKHGDIIGKVGSTGNSTGPHLHLGIKDNRGEWMNPRFLLSNHTGGK